MGLQIVLILTEERPFNYLSHFLLGGVAFLKPYVRRGILPKMLEEILDTRLMVKRSMKLYNQESKKDPGRLNIKTNYLS